MDSVYTLGPFRLDISSDPLPGGRPRAGRAASCRRAARLGRASRGSGFEGCLLQAAWPDLAVEESNLTVQIAARFDKVTNRAAQAIAECERALALDRNLARAHRQIGVAKCFMVAGQRPRPTSTRHFASLHAICLPTSG